MTMHESLDKLLDTSAGVKHDDGKPRMELLSNLWLKGVAYVLTKGANKYSADNWRKGLSQRRVLGAALRHIFAYLDGEDLDQETGLSHLDHASCELMFASELRLTHPHLDDRYKATQLNAPPLLGEPLNPNPLLDLAKCDGEWLQIAIDDDGHGKAREVLAFVPKTAPKKPLSVFVGDV